MALFCLNDDGSFSEYANKPILRAGAGKAPILITPEMLPLDGFADIHDPVFVRALMLNCVNSGVIVSIEMTSLSDACCDALKALVSEKTGVAEDGVWICVTHTFSVPHILSGSAAAADGDRKKSALLWNALLAAAGEAASDAVAGIQDAVLSIGSDSCDVNVCRDIHSVAGWWIGLNPDGPSDKTLTVLRFDDRSGNAIGLIYHYAVQSSVMDGVTDSKGERQITGDLIGKASQTVESSLGDQSVALFLPGASGDQAPREKAKYAILTADGGLTEKFSETGGYTIMENLGRRLGGAVLGAVLRRYNEKDMPVLSHAAATVICPKQKRSFEGFPAPSLNCISVPDGEVVTELRFLRIGKEIMLAGIKPEINCVTALDIKKDSPFTWTLLAQMVNGGQKYMADRESYDRMTYEAMNSIFGKGAAEKLRDSLCAIFRTLKL
jgi:hypothetical protein